MLPNQYLAASIDAEVISAGDSEIPPENIQPASLDLRLGKVAYRTLCSFLPTNHTVAQRMKDVVIGEVDLAGDGAVLTPGHPYLIPLKERLRLPPGVRGKANPKSSTGRADVFTRVITDGSYRFDEVRAGYHGGLYLEVAALSFPVIVREDLSLNQLRLSVGRTELSDDEVRTFHSKQPLLFEGGVAIEAADLRLSGGLFLGLDLRGDKTGRVGYRARNDVRPLDLTRVRFADPAAYWDHAMRGQGKRIVLTPKMFYLLMSYESVTVPPKLAAEMTAYDPTSGELRTHYAGFFDPGFGYDSGGRFTGSTAALEVRAHDVPFMIDHRQPVCKLTFEQMLEEPTQLYGSGISSNYQRQTETLGKHFRSPASSSSGGRTQNQPVSELQLSLNDEHLDLLTPEL